MGTRNILRDTDKSLRKPSREITKFDRRLHILLDDMIETLAAARGAGLAAPQVGVLRRVCIVEATGEENAVPIELINPRIVDREGENRGPEGCLSIPGKTGWVTRPERVKVEALDRHGNPFTIEAEGFEARAFCHEIDHLDGVLYTDIMEGFLSPEELLELNREDDETDE